MGVQIAVAFPVLEGQKARVRNFGRELEPNSEEWERLNREATVTRYGVWLQESPMGDLAIVVMEADDPTRIGRAFTDSAYDQWWLDFLRDCHGIALHGVLPEQIPAPPRRSTSGRPSSSYAGGRSREKNPIGCHRDDVRYRIFPR